MIGNATNRAAGQFGTRRCRLAGRLLVPVLACALAVQPAASRAQDGPKDPKSPGKAMLLSLVLPGAGELYAGGPRSGRFFLFTEGLFWTGMAVFKTLEGSRTDTYRAFAAQHAGVQLAGKSDSFIEEVGLHSSIYTRNAREVFVSGEFADLRPETPDQTWEWDSDASRFKFHTLRSKATSAEQKAFLFVGALVFNRFASALNAASIARRSQASPPGRALRVTSAAAPDGGVRLTARLSF